MDRGYFGLRAAYSPPRLIAELGGEIIYKHGHRLVLPCHAVGTPPPTYVSPPLSTCLSVAVLGRGTGMPRPFHFLSSRPVFPPTTYYSPPPLGARGPGNPSVLARTATAWCLVGLFFWSIKLIRFIFFLSASLYFSKRGAYWDRLCRDVVGRWLVVTRVHCGQTVHPRPIVTIWNTNRKPYPRNSMVQLSTPWGDP